MEPLQSPRLSQRVSKGLPTGGFSVPLTASQGSPLPPEAAPSPSWERIEKMMSERREKDLQSFGIETHLRAPVNAYRYPPRPRIEREGGPAAFKPKYRDVWDPVHPPTDGTPRLAERHHGLSRPGKHTVGSYTLSRPLIARLLSITMFNGRPRMPIRYFDDFACCCLYRRLLVTL